MPQRRLVPVVTLLQTATTVAGVALLAIYVAFAALLGYWVYRDATAREANAGLWVLVSLLVPFGIVAYLYLRQRWPRIDAPTRQDRQVETVLLAATGGMVAGAFLAPPDPVTQVALTVGVAVALLPVTYRWHYRSTVGPDGGAVD